ncbi:MAG: CDP-diacylglycerol--glycerol-3-phosphate 3-phosphatidyltransferase [Gammaproteobacteria bacterium]|nr:CDP-diacylglycerol--glycerol-3-phosphate 3-phosphatidyltransferase [Gammaproteobacteria bacterium]
MLNLPNILSLGRIFVIPFLVLVFYLPVAWAHTAAAIIFALACLTDWLDGYLARSLKQATKFGAFLDPVADKMMVSIVLVLIAAEQQFQVVSWHANTYVIPAFVITLPAAIIVSREVIVSALREWMSEVGKRTSVAVSHLGKIKTTLQMISLIILLYCSPSVHPFFLILGYITLYAAAVLTIWTMVIYLKASWPEFKID